MTARIALSSLPRPSIPGLVRSVDEVHADILQWLVDTYDWTLTPNAADPAWRLSRLLAARESLLRQSIDDDVAQVSLAYARGAMLDHIGLTYIGLPRKEGERDEVYRDRLMRAPERFAVGLSEGWYEETARTIAGVHDAQFVGPNVDADTLSLATDVAPAAGHGYLYIQADETLTDAQGAQLYPDGVPNAALRTAVTAAISADDTAQQTDDVTVKAPRRVLYDVAVTLTMRSDTAAGEARAAALAALQALADDRDRLGQIMSTRVIAGAVFRSDWTSDVAVTLQEVKPAQGVEGQPGYVAETLTSREQVPHEECVGGSGNDCAGGVWKTRIHGVAPQARHLTVSVAP